MLKRRAHLIYDSAGLCFTVAATMLNANMEWMLVRAYALAQAHRYQFKLLKIPESFRLLPDLFDFDPEMMKSLFEVGRELGRNPSSWVVAPSLARTRLRGSSRF